MGLSHATHISPLKNHTHTPNKTEKTKTLEKASLPNQKIMESSQNHEDKEHYIKN
jgi:hypothetical protein